MFAIGLITEKRDWPAMGAVLATIAGLTFAAAASDAVTAGWQFDRLAIFQGEWWRLLTGHLTHWNWDHLFWDLCTCLALTAVCLKRNFAGTVSCLLGSALAISLGILLFQPEIAVYRGLSGVDSALFVLLAVELIFEARRRQQWTFFWLSLIGVLGLAAKTAFELLTGDTLFVDSPAAGFVPLVSAHVIGAAVGALIGLTMELRRKYSPPRFSDWATIRAGLGRTGG